MNFYKRYPGDYAKKTARLSLMQHGAYGLLLDEFYLSESPLPAAFDDLYRICRAMRAPEQEAVRVVAERFFPIGPDGLRHNSRADEELVEAMPALEAARANGRKGGRPKEETHKKPSGFQKHNPEETHKKPTPEPPHNSESSSLRSEDMESEFAELWQAYPKRPGASRIDARKAWQARRKAGVEHETMLAGVKRYAAYCAAEGTDPKYIKQPATFLGPSEHYLSDWTPSQRGASAFSTNRHSAAAAGVFDAPQDEQEVIDV